MIGRLTYQQVIDAVGYCSTLTFSVPDEVVTSVFLILVALITATNKIVFISNMILFVIQYFNKYIIFSFDLND